MSTATSPERMQRPDIGTILDDNKMSSPIDSQQLSRTASRPDSSRSKESFKSSLEQVQTDLLTIPTPGSPTILTPSTPVVRYGPTRTPLTAPLPDVTAKPAANLDAQQKAMYTQVLDTVSKWTTIPVSCAKNAPDELITDNERMWLTRECILRYLRATKWKPADAIRRLQSTLSWRREYGADTFTADYISPENETGKQVVMGYDREARPCLYLNPGKQNTEMSDRQIHHLSYMLDRTLDMLPPGSETTCLLINFKGASGGKIPTVGQAKAVLNILQNHNPERLGRALISELPWLVSAFFKMISPFIDPVTREKMKFNENLTKYVPKEQLWNAYGGLLDFEYDHTTYWKALDAECAERRELYKARWVAAGKHIGEYEEYLRGGQVASLKQAPAPVDGLADNVQKLQV